MSKKTINNKSIKKKKDWDLVEDLMDNESLFEESTMKFSRPTASS